MTTQRYPVVLPAWPAPLSVHALSTTRLLPGYSSPPYASCNLGLRTGEAAEIVQSNRRLLLSSLQLPAIPRWLRQVHGSTTVTFGDADFPDSEIEGDAAVTRSQGVVLAVLTADCLPVLLCARDGSEIGAIHAGWRGLAGGVIENCVERMFTPADGLLAWLGPGIGRGSYEVGSDVRDAFVARAADAASTAFEPSRQNRWHCDLYALARSSLKAVGIQEVYGGDCDTYSDCRFYSHRRDHTSSGRFATLIWLGAM